MQKKLAWLAAAAVTLFMAIPAWAGPGRDALRGADFVIGNWWENYDVNTFQPVSEAERRQLEYRRRMLNEHGFRMVHRQLTSWTDMLSTVALSIMTGSPAANAVWMEAGWAMTLHRQNLLAPIPASVALPPSPLGGPNVPWNQTVMRNFTFGGQRFGVNPLGYAADLQELVVFFNKRLFREAGLDPMLPYNMQRDRTWTWDNFLPIARQLTRDTTGDGITDTWAMTAGLSTEIFDAIMSSNGANYVTRNAQGRFVNSSGSPAFLEALNFFIRLRDEGVMMPEPEGANWDWYQSVFMDGRSAFMVEPLWRRQDLYNMQDDWGMVLFPMGPRVSDFVVFTSSHVLVVPAGTAPPDVERLFAAMNLWFRPVDTGPTAWQEGLWDIFRDTRAVTETMAIILNPARHQTQYHRMVPGLQRGQITYGIWYNEGDASQLVEAVGPQWNALINDLNGDLF